MKQLVALIQSLRPRQWIKNTVLFAPLLFSQNLFHKPALAASLAAFGLFCLLSGGLYLLNDLKDLEGDRQHPLKKNRPLASGRLRPLPAVIFAVVLIAASLLGGLAVSRDFFLAQAAYVVLQLLYTFDLKHRVILDVFSIGASFFIRVIAGGAAIRVELSPWLLICTILLSLFLALAKRRHELILLQDEAGGHRKILEEYSPYLLDQMISVVTAATLMSYILYTVSEETVRKFQTTRLIYSIPFVLYGIFRYLYLVHQKTEGGSPEEVLLTDRPLLATVLGWVLAVGLVLYR